MGARRLVGNEALCVVEFRVLRFIGVDAVLHLVSEVTDETLYRLGRSVAESADRVSFHLKGELLKHIDLCVVSISNLNSLEDVEHPASSLSAGSALSA